MRRDPLSVAFPDRSAPALYVKPASLDFGGGLLTHNRSKRMEIVRPDLDHGAL
jgi:hypothetical protein